VENAVREQPSVLLSYLRKALHRNYSDVAREQLPSRWVDLIQELNDRERDEEFRKRAEALAARRNNHSIN
jgi:hypothetical protein